MNARHDCSFQWKLETDHFTYWSYWTMGGWRISMAIGKIRFRKPVYQLYYRVDGFNRVSWEIPNPVWFIMIRSKKVPHSYDNCCCCFLVPPFSVPLYGDSWWFMYIIWSRRYFLDTENRQTCREQIVKPQHHFFYILSILSGLVYVQFCRKQFDG